MINTAFVTQIVLCEAPYCLAILYYIYVQHERSLPLHITLLQWSKSLFEVVRVNHVHTTSIAQFRLRICR